MRRIGTLVAAAALVLGAALDSDGQETVATPEQQFDELLAKGRGESIRGVLTDAERMQYVARAYRRQYELAPRFIELAERHPKDPIAIRALIQAAWQVNSCPWPVEMVGDDLASGRALAILQRDHLGAAELTPLCRRIGYGLRSEYEPFLRAVLAGSPHLEVRAVACLALARFLNQRLQRLDLLDLQPESRKEFAALFGAEYLDTLRRMDRAEASREIVALLERATKEFASVQLPDEGTIGDQAAAELFAVRNLCVGATAPEIAGDDQQGVRFKLSDYRGKVVLLDFWSWV